MNCKLEHQIVDVDRESTDRRARKERRQPRWPTFRELLQNRRRRSVRRKSDRRSMVLLDQYNPSMLLPAILVLLLSVVDALLTLFLLEHGAVELNPIMLFFIKKGPTTFLIVKYTITAVSVLIIVLLNYVFMRYFKLFARDLLTFFACGFALVICWEIFLVVRYVL